jgi:predicted RNA-binding Zn-ribbon protein involved in translation (DUF1610 family)
MPKLPSGGNSARIKADPKRGRTSGGPPAGSLEDARAAADELAPMPRDDGRAEFVCPECGSTRPATAQMIGRHATPVRDPNPWAVILQVISCSSCGYRIPAHLAERWEGRSVEQARREWGETYREWPDAREDEA